MKFGKEFASQMVPEWQEAYMDYDYLKTILKEIQIFKQKNRAPPQAQPSSSSSALMRKLTLYRAFSGLTHRTQTHAPDIEDQQPILVNPVKKDGDKVEGSETLFLMAAEEGGEYEMVYFRRLDDEFNKVVRFFKGKVEEVMEEAEMLNKQMDALIAFRVRVENPQGRVDWSGEMTRLASGIASSAAALSASTPSGAKAGGRAPMEISQEDEPNSTEESDESSHGKEMKTMNQPVKQHKSENIRGARPAPLEVLNHVKMNNTLETPRSTIKGLLHDSTETELKFSRANLRKVEEQLKKAFGEFYQKIRLLKSFNFLNVLAFSKIMKKYDKVSGRNAARSYMKMVDNSYLGSCDEIIKLMERAEATFIKHFCNSNRRKGMAILRPKAKKERHRTTFSLGFLAGCAFALYLALILIVRTRQLLGSPGRLRYMETMFPLYSLFGFIFLHMVMYAANIFFWRRYRVNYTFIFGFKEGTELGYREVFLLSFGLAVLALASVHANLDMEMDTNTSNFKAVTELLPLGLLVLVVAILICPLNIIYRSSRFFLLTCIFHCICAPLYKVLLPDFFLADQLTSQVQAFRNLEFYICYYGWGDYKRRESNCHDYVVFEVFYYIVAAIPFWVRFLQCLRRLYEEKDPMQGYNGLKYFATIVALCMRTAYRFNQGFTWRLMAGISSAIATIVATYWDTVIDWGLLNRNSENRWLRDKLLVPHKIVYFSAMVLNVLLRLAWMQSVLNFKIRFLHTETVAAILAGLEILRRGIWNFFRLENEHLNNVGKYRAFKTVPLPFNYDEDDDKDE